MKLQTIKKAAYIALCLSFFIASKDCNAEDALPAAEEISHAHKLLNEKVEYYRSLYPDILFLILNGGDKLVEDIVMLDLILGHQPSSLDYEHPPASREDLMYVSIERILFMLRNDAPSASLFKADDPGNWQEHVCVLTISPDEIASDSICATGYLLNLSDEIIRKIPRNFQLLADDFLEYVIDHEVYHCLYSMYVGPQEMSDKDLWGEYSHYLGEQGADAYAVAMHIRNREQVSRFPRNLQRIRGMTLYNGEADHMTTKALEQVISIPREKILYLSQNEIFELAKRIKSDQTISYNDYVQYLASAVQAMQLIGVDETYLEDLKKITANIQVDPEQVKELVENSRRCFAELNSDILEN